MAELETKLRIRGEGFAQARRDLRALRDDVRGVGTSVRSAARDVGPAAKFIGDQLRSARTALVGFFTFQGISAGVRSFARTSDVWTEINARLALAERNQQAFNRAQRALFTIAQETRQQIAGTIDLYARITRSTKQLNTTQDQRLAVTRAISQALVVSGANAESGAAAVFQLGQGLASGQLRGEELNSVLEQTPRLAEAIAAGLGKSVGDLRSLAEAGVLTSERIIQALLSQTDELQDEFQRMPLTIGQALTLMGNQWTRYIGKTNDASGANRTVAGTLQLIGENLDKIIDTVLRLGAIVVAVLVTRAVPALKVYVAGQLAALTASRAAAAQELITAEARAVAAHRALRHAEAMVAEAEAAVAASTGMRRLAIAQQQLVPARRALTRATQAHTAALEAEAIAQAKTVRSFRLVRSSAASSRASVMALKTAFGTLTGAVNVLFAAFSGWQIGGWLRENFQVVREFSVALVGGLVEAGERISAFFDKVGVTIEYALSQPLNFLRTALATFLADVAEFAASIPGIGEQVAAGLRIMADSVKPENDAAAAYQAKLDQIERDLAERIARQRDIFTGMFRDAGRSPAGNDIDVSEGALAGTVDLSGGAGLTADEIQKQLADARVELLRATGETAAAQIAEIEAKYDELLVALRAKGDKEGVALVEQLIDVQSARARFDELYAAAETTLDRVSQREQAIQAEQQAGLLTEQQARARIVELHRQTGAELDALVPKLRAMAEASGDPRAVEQVEQLRLEIEQLGRTANEVHTRIRGSIESEFASGIASMIDQTKSAAEAFDDMADGVIKAINRIVSEIIASQIVDYLFRVFGPGTGSVDTGASGYSSDGMGPPSSLAGVKHTGGIAGRGNGRTRRVPMSLFASARRFHGGGIAGRHLRPGEVPIIANDGEGIFTQEQMAALAPVGAGGNMVVNITPPAGYEARTERSSDGRGGMRLDVMFDEMMASKITKGGKTAQAIERVFGARRQGR